MAKKSKTEEFEKGAYEPKYKDYGAWAKEDEETTESVAADRHHTVREQR
jgi:hypothetical protein